MSAPVLILLHPDDNVLVATRDVSPGDPLVIEGVTIDARVAIGTAHKVARIPATPGDKVIKYGMPIGSFTQAVMPGDWVHLHNMKSDYMDAHTRAGLAGQA